MGRAIVHRRRKFPRGETDMMKAAGLVLVVTVVIVRLVEEEIGSKFLVLVASEVGLDGLVTIESKTA